MAPTSAGSAVVVPGPDLKEDRRRPLGCAGGLGTDLVVVEGVDRMAAFVVGAVAGVAVAAGLVIAPERVGKEELQAEEGLVMKPD